MGFISHLVRLHATAFVHESAQLYGLIDIEAEASVWPQAVARAEVHGIRIGHHTNVQDFVMLHVGVTSGVSIGAHCSIAHHATLHGCEVGDNCLVGIHATVADGCVIGDNSVIGAHTYVAEGTVIPPDSVVTGIPGRVLKVQNNFVSNRLNAFAYARNAQAYREGDHQLWGRASFQAELQQERLRLLEMVSPVRVAAAGHHKSIEG